MRILFLIRSLDHGGAERQLAVLAGELTRRGHTVAVAVFYGDGPLRRELDQAGVTVFDLKKSGRWDIPAFLFRLIRVARRFRPQVLHGYLPVSNSLAALASRFLPGVKLVFGVRASDMDLGRYDRLSAAAYHLEARLSPLADAVISNSQAGRRAVTARGIPAERCHVIPNGIDTDRFHADRALGQSLRQGWGIPPESRLVGMVARIDPMKGHEVFLRAAAQARAIDPSLRFVCVGKGDAALTEQLRLLANDLSLPVIWVGAHDAVAAVYNAFDLFVMPSLYGEGFPNVLAEAMACGLPCVATDVGDAREILEPLGQTVQPGDVEALAQAILNAPKSPCPTAVTRIGETYSVTQLADRTLTVLNHIVGAPD
ncbi:glycosyltransferase [Magnetospirillum molischianum]|nr:glycosyltransferase [Magnetospirillum molischianum]